ncbi:MAG: thiolase family protein [Nitrosopumilaceae archaeon]
MNRVAITNFGNTKFSHDDIPIETCLLSSTKSLFNQNPNVSKNDIDAVLVATNENEKYLAPILSELSGIKPKISHTVENLCSSGTNAIVSAYSYIASGLANVALVVGAERYDSPGQILEWDNSRGEYKHPIFWASIFTKSYKRKFGVTDEDLAIVSVKNHKNAKDNPNAYSNKIYTVEDVLHSKKLTEELKILDCSRPCTGSSAVLLASESFAKNIIDTPVWIEGIGQKTTSASFTKNQNFTEMTSTKEAARLGFENAKIQPTDIKVAEIHDAFSVCEPIILEDLGFAEKGNGLEFSKKMYETEDRKINPRGGLIGAGHPLSATGVAQTIEIVQQLQGKAGKRQISNADIGLVHNMSAAATSSTVLLLKS